jgi:hypothetical protein
LENGGPFCVFCDPAGAMRDSTRLFLPGQQSRPARR